MKLITILSTFLIFMNSNLLACEINLPKIIVKDANLTPSEIKFEHNCPVETVNKLKNFVCQNTGTFSTQQISRYVDIPLNNFKGDGSLQVYNLNEFLNEKQKPSQDKSFFGSSFIGTKKYLSLANKHQVKIVCDNCEQSLGEKNIKLVNTGEEKDQTIWLKTSLAFEVEAFFPKKIMHPTSDVLSRASFIKRSTASTQPQNLITDIKKIKFLQLRRMLDPNKPISKTDFVQHNLIIAGRHANVVFKSNGVNLSLKAIPLSYGKFGETVRLRNPKSNKIIIGKVIDFNTVLVEL